jgi:hypothetical protein
MPLQQMFAINNAAETNGTEDAQHVLLSASHAYAYLLVAGAALETMLKAAAIQVALNANGYAGVVAASGVKLQRWLTTHKLESLVKRLGIDCNEIERDHVERFTKYIEWAGRYPTPRTEAKNTAGATPYIVSDFDRHMFLTLFRKAEAAFHSATMNAKLTAGKDVP